MSLFRKFVFNNNVKVLLRMSSSFNKASESVYRYQPGHLVDDAEKWPKATQEMKEDYENNGYLLVKNLLTEVELEPLLPALGLKSLATKGSSDVDTFDHRAEGQMSKLGLFRHDKHWGLVLWNEQGKDFLGVLSGNAKLAGIAEQLLNRGEIYLYHGKLLRKEAKQGGEAAWHQDYASWYKNELIFPDLSAVTIALTESNRANGGTQVIKGSHVCGRIEHNVTRIQQGADEDRVALVKKALPVVPLDLAPGDGVFMHPNLLRSSGPNNSNNLRCHLKFVFNTKQNSPAMKHDWSDDVYKQLDTYPVDALLKLKKFDIQDREFSETERAKMEEFMTVWDL